MDNGRCGPSIRATQLGLKSLRVSESRSLSMSLSKAGRCTWTWLTAVSLKPRMNICFHTSFSFDDSDHAGEVTNRLSCQPSGSVRTNSVLHSVEDDGSARRVGFGRSWLHWFPHHFLFCRYVNQLFDFHTGHWFSNLGPVFISILNAWKSLEKNDFTLWSMFFQRFPKWTLQRFLWRSSQVSQVNPPVKRSQVGITFIPNSPRWLVLRSLRPSGLLQVGGGERKADGQWVACNGQWWLMKFMATKVMTNNHGVYKYMKAYDGG